MRTKALTMSRRANAGRLDKYVPNTSNMPTSTWK